MHNTQFCLSIYLWMDIEFVSTLDCYKCEHLHTSLLFHLSRQSIKTARRGTSGLKKNDSKKTQREYQLPIGQHQTDHTCITTV